MIFGNRGRKNKSVLRRWKNCSISIFHIFNIFFLASLAKKGYTGLEGRALMQCQGECFFLTENTLKVMILLRNEREIGRGCVRGLSGTGSQRQSWIKTEGIKS